MMVMVNLIMMSAVVMVTMLMRAPEYDLDHDSHNVGDDSDYGTNGTWQSV